MRAREPMPMSTTAAWRNDAEIRRMDIVLGSMWIEDLKRVAKELGENMTDEELNEMIEEADRDGDGEISEEDFIRIMKKTNLF